jgi:hypothetical protein
VNKKSLLSAFLTVILIAGLVLASAMHFETVQASTDVIGIITSDTTWTKANSPYSLTGPTAVGEGATLTIEAGTTVNFNDYYIVVNGTLRARGSSTDQIHLNGGQITFTSVSNSWNEQTDSGSIIENTVLNSEIKINNASPKIDNSSVNAPISVSGSSVISNNIIKSDVSVLEGSPEILNNVVTGQIKTYLGKNAGFMPVISHNIITGGGIACYGGNNYGGYAFISDNIISGCQTGILGGDGIIERNYIFNNNVGIEIQNGIIRNNNITSNSRGIYIPLVQFYFFGWGEVVATPTILNNNIYANTNYNIYLAVSNNVSATNNWWGTTDKQTISQKIYDNKNDFNLGKVNFEPFLTAPNPEAPEASDVPTPTPTPTSTPSLSPSPTTSPEQEPSPTPSQEPMLTPEQFEVILGVAIAVAVFGAGLGLLIYLIKRK